MDKLKNKIQDHIHNMDIDEPRSGTWDAIKNSLSTTQETDLLKEHINSNKEELNIDTPDAAAWNHIHNTIATKNPSSIKPIRRIIIYLSAAACIIALISLTVLRFMNNNETNAGNEETKEMVTKEKKNPEAIIIDSTEEEVALEEHNTSTVPAKASTPTIKNKSLAANTTKPVTNKKIALPPQVVQMEKVYDELIAGQVKYTKSLAIYGESAAYFEMFRNDFKLLEDQEKELRKAIAKNGLQENSIDELAMIYQQKLTVLKKLQNEINKTSSRNKNPTDTIPVYINL